MNTKTIGILLVCVVTLLGFLATNIYFMPMGMFYTTLLALIVLFGFFAANVWRENGGDEREQSLLYKADRIAFLVGTLILLSAIVVEGIVMHMVNQWVLGAFFAMVIAKVFSYIYFEKNN